MYILFNNKTLYYSHILLFDLQAVLSIDKKWGKKKAVFYELFLLNDTTRKHDYWYRFLILDSREIK